VGGDLAGLGAVDRGVFLVCDTAENFLGLPAGMFEVHLVHIAEGDSAMLGADLVLRDQGPVFTAGTLADTEAKTVHFVVKFDMLGLAGGHPEARYALGRVSWCWPLLGRLWED
jgi:hypothetical protein